MVSVGPEAFYKMLFKSMGIQLTPNVLHYLSVKDKQRAVRLRKQKLAKSKLARNKRNFEKLQQDTLIAKKERLTRAGKYRRGMNLDITVEEEQAIQKQIIRAAAVCPHPFCGLKGHKTTNAKSCRANPARLLLEGNQAACAAAVAAAASTVSALENAHVGLEAEDLNRHEAVPLVDADDSSIEMYAEAQTWSEDEDGNIV